MINDTTETPYRILVIENDEAERYGIKELLISKISNCEITEADAIQSAEELLAEGLPFDLVILDLCLIDTDEPTGLELLRPTKPLSEWSGQTRIIIYTGKPTWETCRQAYEAGANAYISKKDKDAHEQLVKKTRELLELREVRERVRRQLEAQHAAEQAFAKNHGAWLKEHAGKFVLWREGEVVGAFDKPEDVWQCLSSCTEEERAKTGIVRVE